MNCADPRPSSFTSVACPPVILQFNDHSQQHSLLIPEEGNYLVNQKNKGGPTGSTSRLREREALPSPEMPRETFHQASSGCSRRLLLSAAGEGGHLETVSTRSRSSIRSPRVQLTLLRPAATDVNPAVSKYISQV